VSALRSIAWHLYQSLVMPDRLAEYRELLRSIAAKGYTFSTVEAFASNVTAGCLPPEQACVLRVDIDSDAPGAARMFDIAAAEGVRGTYYFRLSTLDRSLAQHVRAQGSEAGYHFEELATFAKRHGLRNAEEVEAHVPAMRDEFRRNVMRFRDAAGEFPRTVAAHGDFLNRRFGIRNSQIIDRPLMDEFAILAETSEPRLMGAVTARVSDRPAPRWWHPRSPIEAMSDSPSVLYILVHPRQWVRAPLHNIGLDLQRGTEEAAYFWHCLRRRNA
jgi:hypothetical protein